MLEVDQNDVNGIILVGLMRVSELHLVCVGEVEERSGMRARELSSAL